MRGPLLKALEVLYVRVIGKRTQLKNQRSLFLVDSLTISVALGPLSLTVVFMAAAFIMNFRMASILCCYICVLAFSKVFVIYLL
jgi:hypothetical protein